MALALSLGACSHKSKCLTKGVDVEISGDHPHSATVSVGSVDRGEAHTYLAHGDAHQHMFLLQAADMQKLQHGEPVHTRTTSTNAHAHEVNVTCKE
jgi:hypothetical protein